MSFIKKTQGAPEKHMFKWWRNIYDRLKKRNIYDRLKKKGIYTTDSPIIFCIVHPHPYLLIEKTAFARYSFQSNLEIRG